MSHAFQETWTQKDECHDRHLGYLRELWRLAFILTLKTNTIAPHKSKNRTKHRRAPVEESHCVFMPVINPDRSQRKGTVHILSAGGGSCVFVSVRSNPPIRQQILQVVIGGTFSKWHCRAEKIVILLFDCTARACILLFDVWLEGNGENKNLAG